MDGMGWLNGLFPSSLRKGRVAVRLRYRGYRSGEKRCHLKQEKAPSKLLNDVWRIKIFDKKGRV